MSEALESLEPLFEKANKEGLWFYSNYQQLWFSPSELKKHNENGQFRWGAVNWQLRDPHEQFSDLYNRKSNIDKEITSLKERIANK